MDNGNGLVGEARLYKSFLFRFPPILLLILLGMMKSVGYQTQMTNEQFTVKTQDNLRQSLSLWLGTLGRLKALPETKS